MRTLAIRASVAVCAVACMIAAPQPREAATSGAVLKYAALGDSLAASTFDPAQSGYVPQVALNASTDLGLPVELTTRGVYGATSRDLLALLQSDNAVRAAVADADIVTWNIGLNDLHAARLCYVSAIGCGPPGACGGADNQECWRVAVDAFAANWDAIIFEIESLTASNPFVVIRTMDLYNPYIAWDIDPAVRDVVKTYFDAFNARIHTSAVAASIRVADVYASFNGADGTADPSQPPRQFLEQDLVHPNNAGSEAIATRFRELGYAPYDNDGDGVSDLSDNCPDIANADQANSDGNLIMLAPLKPYNDHSRAASDDLGDACDTDDDNDNRPDAAELDGAGCGSFAAPTDPRAADTDGDNFRDGVECILGVNPNDVHSRPLLAYCGSYADPDHDGITSNREVCFYGTDPLNPNSDGDACADGKEMASINRSGTVEVVDVQQVAFENGPYTLPGTAVEVDFDMTKNGTIDVLDLQQLAARLGGC